MLVRVDEALRSHRRRLVILCTMAVLAASVVSAHSALAGGDHMGMGVAMCLAVVDTAVAAAATVLAISRPAHRMPAPRLMLLVPEGRPRSAPSPRSRAGPAELQVFRL